jgi:hypothetical protein
MPSCLERFPGFAEFLNDAPERDAPWPAIGITERELRDVCDAEGLWGLLHARFSRSSFAAEWPAAARDDLCRTARAHAAEELLRAVEVRAVLAALTDAGIQPVLLKGTSLAYGVYPTPEARTRSDTDLMIRACDVEGARAVFESCGYRAAVHCSELFAQFEMQREDRFGLVHAMDVHWRISTQPVFLSLLTYEELVAGAQPVPALGPNALGAGMADALLLACVHPVMHHRNAERALWIYDVHLLVSRLSPPELESFASRARRKGVAAICAHTLRLAQRVFGTEIPMAMLQELDSARGEVSAEYLVERRRWHHELLSSVKAVEGRERLRLLREVLLPRPAYVLGAYGLRGTRIGMCLLPALYVHRAARGAWKIATGRK